MCRPRIMQQKIRTAPPRILPIIIAVVLPDRKSGWVESVPDGFIEEEARTLVLLLLTNRVVCDAKVGTGPLSGVAEADPIMRAGVMTDEAAEVKVSVMSLTVDSEIVVTPLDVELDNITPLPTEI